LQVLGKLREDKRGVGTLIAAVFIIMIVLTGYSLYLMTSNEMQAYHEVLREMMELDYDRSLEDVLIKEVRVTAESKLNVTAQNEGPKQVKIVWVGLMDKTQYPENDKYAAASLSISPGETVTGIGSDFSISSGHNYIVQLVTERGNVVSHSFYPARSVKCKLELIVVPSSVYVGENITVLLIITHNQTEPDSIQSVTAKLTASPQASVKLLQEPRPTSVIGLKSGCSATFMWIYNASQTGTVYFNASYVEAPQGSYEVSQVMVKQKPKVTITGPSTISRAVWTNFIIKAFDENGYGVPYAWITVAASDTNVRIRLLGTNQYSNPFNSNADSNGAMTVQVYSNAGGGSTFTLYATFDTVYSSMTIVQLP
jgi:hypothetical protein